MNPEHLARALMRRVTLLAAADERLEEAARASWKIVNEAAAQAAGYDDNELRQFCHFVVARTVRAQTEEALDETCPHLTALRRERYIAATLERMVPKAEKAAALLFQTVRDGQSRARAETWARALREIEKLAPTAAAVH
ncbi:MAG: hypothetical protein KBA31_00140 [Alphaproteobacteria bacterium]|nr:hypothetical protein [Alphaproteobacteria bacterium]